MGIKTTDVFDYYEIKFKLKTPQLGTIPKMSIYHEHIIEKAKKEMAKANKLRGKVTKALDKYKGDSIEDNKHLEELQGVVRAYCQILGKPMNIPESLEGLLATAQALEKDFDEAVKAKEVIDATTFLRDRNGWPILSTHMILGNFKENMRNMVNGTKDKSLKEKLPLTSKVSVGEVFATDIKPVFDFMIPNHDIVRAGSQEEADSMTLVTPGEDGGGYFAKGKAIWEEKTGRVILERPAIKEDKGVRQAIILNSEMLPPGTEFTTVIRVRKNSPITMEALELLLELGKSNGFGSWRGSGNMGSYYYQIEKLEDFEEPKPEGGWR